MSLKSVFFLVLLWTISLSFKAESKTTSNVTVIGSVFCDSCSEGTFSKRSYFLQGARVLIQCRLESSSASRKGIISITSNETTDKYGVYQLYIPRIGGFKCRKGRDKSSPCHATLLESPSSLCNLKGLRISTTHIAIQPPKSNLCILNLNSLNFRPPKRNVAYCGPHNKSLPSTSLDSSSFFFWPLIPPFLLPWLHWPPLPFAFPPLPFPFNTIPLPDPTSLPFSLPPWLIPFLNPSSLPYPFSLFPPSTPPPTPNGP